MEIISEMELPDLLEPSHLERRRSSPQRIDERIPSKLWPSERGGRLTWRGSKVRIVEIRFSRQWAEYRSRVWCVIPLERFPIRSYSQIRTFQTCNQYNWLSAIHIGIPDIAMLMILVDKTKMIRNPNLIEYFGVITNSNDETSFRPWISLVEQPKIENTFCRSTPVIE